MRPGDLVMDDRCYGIVLDVERRFVLFGDGRQEFLDRGRWGSLTWLLVRHSGEHAHFGKLVEAFLRVNPDEAGQIFQS